MDAEPRHSTVDLFNRLGWLPFYLESDIKKCALAYKRTVGELLQYTNSMLKLNSEQHSRRTQSAHLSFIIPLYIREREAGRCFTVTACNYWNNLPINLRSSASTSVLKQGLYKHFRSFQSIHKQFSTFLNCNFWDFV